MDDMHAHMMISFFIYPALLSLVSGIYKNNFISSVSSVCAKHDEQVAHSFDKR